MKSYVVLFCAILAFAASVQVDYTGHMVIRAFPQTKEQLEFLRDWQSSGSIDFWSLPASNKEFADIRVSPESYYHVAKTLAEMNMDHKIQVADIGKLIKEERQTIELRRALHNGKAFDHTNYHTYEEIMAYLADLANTNPLVTTKVGGTTGEGREIVQVTISSDLAANKPVNFFDCNIHAREWITSATCIWIIDQLTSGYGTDAEITALVDQYDWKFVPVTNPDGHAYTWSSDRLWRKNRVVNDGSACMGVDPNRNFLAGFGGSGASNLACSETYHGVAAFSEKESSALRDLIAADRGRVNIAISVHSYSQLYLSPYGYKTDLPAEYADMMVAMKAAVDALTATYGTQYLYGNTADTIYIASGDTTDHYYENEGVVHSYTIELRDTGTYGFVLPADQIVPTAIETWNSFKALIAAI